VRVEALIPPRGQGCEVPVRGVERQGCQRVGGPESGGVDSRSLEAEGVIPLSRVPEAPRASRSFPRQTVGRGTRFGDRSYERCLVIYDSG